MRLAKASCVSRVRQWQWRGVKKCEKFVDVIFERSQRVRLLPRFIFWYHGAKMINYEDPDGRGGGGQRSGGHGVSVLTRKSEDGLETTSELILRNAAPGDSGNYTCQPSNAGSASIHVFVSEGDFF